MATSWRSRHGDDTEHAVGPERYVDRGRADADADADAETQDADGGETARGAPGRNASGRPAPDACCFLSVFTFSFAEFCLNFTMIHIVIILSGSDCGRQDTLLSFLNNPWRVHADTLELRGVTFCYFLLQSPFR